MPIARFQMPDGRVARFEVPEGTTPEQAQAAFAQFASSQQAPQQQAAPAASQEQPAQAPAVTEPTAQQPAAEGPGFFQRIGQMFTGSDRETRATQELPEIQSSGILNGLDIPAAQGAAFAATLATMNDPAEIAQALKGLSPDIGIQQDEKGNLIAANNKTGVRAVINKPGVSGLDLLQGVAQAAAFVPAGRAASLVGGGLLRQGAALGGASALTQAAIEGAQAGTGGEFNPGEVATAGALGAALPGLEAAGRGALGAISRTADSATEKVLSPVAESLSRQGQAVPENELVAAIQAQQAGVASGAGRTMEQAAESVTNAATSSGRRQIPTLERLADEVKPDETILQAAQRLGLQDMLIPSQYSRSQAYRELEQGLASIPGSQLNTRQKAAAQSLAQKADDFIKEYGGSVDKSAVSEQYKSSGIKVVDDLEKQSSELYDAVKAAIPERTEVNASTTTSYLRNKAADLGGDQYLSPIERRMLNGLIPKSGSGSTINPTYARLDLFRKQVGEGMRGRGPFKDSEGGSLKRLYSALSDDQQAAAEGLGVGETFKAAKSLIVQRKQIEDDLASVLGKDLSGSLTRKTGLAIKNLGSGDFKSFDQLIERVPESMRQQVVLTSLNDAFTAGSRAEKQLSAPGFVDWYSGLKRNDAAMSRIRKYIPTDASAKLEDIYQVARGMREASKERIMTGRIQALMDNFAQEGGMLSKLWDVGKKVATAEGATSVTGLPGVGTAAVLTRELTREKTPVIRAADDLLSSSKFQSALNAYVKKNGAVDGPSEAAQNALVRSDVYKKWLGTLSDATRESISKVGVLNWLSAQDTSEPTEQPKMQQSR